MTEIFIWSDKIQFLFRCSDVQCSSHIRCLYEQLLLTAYRNVLRKGFSLREMYTPLSRIWKNFLKIVAAEGTLLSWWLYRDIIFHIKYSWVAHDISCWGRRLYTDSEFNVFFSEDHNSTPSHSTIHINLQKVKRT